MWPDNETDVDFLNFGSVAETIAEVIVQAAGRPISVGVSGAWGVGKSSLIKLTQAAISGRQPGSKSDPDKYIFVEFNAWLYQGYDDARAALMEVIATKLELLAKERKTGTDKTAEFLRNVNWMRAARLSIGTAIAIALGLPPVGLVGEATLLAERGLRKGVDSELIEDAEDLGGKASKTARSLWSPDPKVSPPKQIQALRDSFESALAELDVTLVVLIDDLDRCLPETTISTLEAIRLFLFLDNTAFVIAADDAMIKHAVRRHFQEPEESLVINYFDKLIQVPIRVPTLGTQEVRAYMMLLYVENSELAREDKDKIKDAVSAQLKQTWTGKRVDRAFVESLSVELPPKLVAQLNSADRLAPLMTTASGILGNPRLVKRFLNALSIRMTISNAQGVGVDEAVLAKLLLFERLGSATAYTELATAINASDDGMASFLAEWETAAENGEDFTHPDGWDSPFINEWLSLPPKLASVDLRGALYVSREHAPIITPEDRLSSDAAELLTALLDHPEMAHELEPDLVKLPRPDLAAFMDRVLARAVQEQNWGVPPILDAALVLTKVDPALVPRLAAFLMDRPVSQIEPSIVPKIRDQAWAQSVFEKWLSLEVGAPVKAAIQAKEKRGNISE